MTVDPASLASFGLSLEDVAGRFPPPISSRRSGASRIITSSIWSCPTPVLHDLSSISMTALRSGKGRRGASGRRCHGDSCNSTQWTRVTADGRMPLSFRSTSSQAAIRCEIDNELKAKLAQFHKHLPPDVNIANWYDQSELILASAASVSRRHTDRCRACRSGFAPFPAQPQNHLDSRSFPCRAFSPPPCFCSTSCT